MVSCAKFPGEESERDMDSFFYQDIVNKTQTVSVFRSFTTLAKKIYSLV